MIDDRTKSQLFRNGRASKCHWVMCVNALVYAFHHYHQLRTYQPTKTFQQAAFMMGTITVFNVMNHPSFGLVPCHVLSTAFLAIFICSCFSVYHYSTHRVWNFYWRQPRSRLQELCHSPQLHLLLLHSDRMLSFITRGVTSLMLF